MKKPHILIVDDEKYATDVLSHVLSKHGMKTTVVHEGGEAIQLLMKKTIDLVILDIKLPLSKVDGWQVLQAMKSEKKTSDIPVFVLSNMGLQQEVARGLELGANEYWLKAHVSIHSIAGRVEELLKEK